MIWRPQIGNVEVMTDKQTDRRTEFQLVDSTPPVGGVDRMWEKSWAGCSSVPKRPIKPTCYIRWGKTLWSKATSGLCCSGVGDRDTGRLNQITMRKVKRKSTSDSWKNLKSLSWVPDQMIHILKLGHNDSIQCRHLTAWLAKSLESPLYRPFRCQDMVSI